MARPRPGARARFGLPQYARLRQRYRETDESRPAGRELGLATMAGPQYGAMEDGMVAIRDGRIAWAGPRAHAPGFEADDRFDGGGGWVTPGLIDCHTHLVYGGNRAAEFEMRLQGATYEEIARQAAASSPPCAPPARPRKRSCWSRPARGSRRWSRKASRRWRSSRATASIRQRTEDAARGPASRRGIRCRRPAS